MKDQPIHMWPYWRDKRGIVDAVLSDYPVLARRGDIEQALNTIQSTEKYLDFLMTELAESDYEE